MSTETLYTSLDFSDLYFRLRQKEGRIYSDDEVARLPEINISHSNYHEWQLRKISSDRLRMFLLNKKRSLQILETGCGNGWLSAKLSAVPESHVTGIDINTAELNQAKRVFSKIRNLEFFNCPLQDEMFKSRKFDIIVFAASVQYFSSLPDILSDAYSLLAPEGEIHIIDSPFYKMNELENARRRSLAYYSSLGFSEMAWHYHHHSLEDIKKFRYKILYNPDSFFNRIKKNKNPFYWICIKGDV
jgi:ubiquinone/menaquinone biosynthesis C-methylase UbiE